VRHRYGDRAALRGVSFRVGAGEIFGLLGPNGSGKTTLFRLLTTMVPLEEGEVRVLGLDLRRDRREIRACIGVVFQRPSLDGKLTVSENLHFHGRLYGMTGSELTESIPRVLDRLGLLERADDLVDILSGGLQRRVELAKALLPRPRLLLLDEPSTGLDPGARRDLGRYLQELRERDGVTVLLTTHFMEEAERCDRVAILHEGDVVRSGSPESLKAALGGDVVVILANDPEGLRARLQERFGCEPLLVDGTVRLEWPQAHELAHRIGREFSADVRSITVGRPTLEDVFIHCTGKRFWEAGVEERSAE
jgi:ABC-2 type transport system ATP-binding protein